MALWAVPSAGPPETATLEKNPQQTQNQTQNLPISMFYSSDDTFILPAVL